MLGSLPFRLNRSGMLLALISAGFAGGAGAAAGRVDFTTAGVTVAGRDGQSRPLAKGTELDNGDTVRTSSEGRAQIRFSDGSYVSLQPNTDFAISDYKFEGKDDDRGFFGLVKGAMRTVTGAVGRVSRNSYKITTPTATVGIRGTGGVIQVLPNGSTLVIGTSGIWSLTNPAGSIDVPAGVSGLAPAEPNTPPKETNTQPQTKPAEVEVKPVYVQGDQVNPDGTADLGTPPPPPIVPLVSGPGYAPAIAYASDFVDSRIDGGDGGEGNTIGNAVFNPAGQLTELTLGSNIYKLGPTGTHAEFGTDGILAWGRWIGPVTTFASAGECGSGCTDDYDANRGFHYVIGMPTAVMPTGGIGNFSLIGATRPTYVNGQSAPGTFSGSFSINFASNALNGTFSAAMSDRTYNWGAIGTASGANFAMNSTSMSGCAGCSCGAIMTGFFSGAGAERAGVSYRINDSVDVIGAAAFKKNP